MCLRNWWVYIIWHLQMMIGPSLVRTNYVILLLFADCVPSIKSYGHCLFEELVSLCLTCSIYDINIFEDEPLDWYSLIAQVRSKFRTPAFFSWSGSMTSVKATMSLIQMNQLLSSVVKLLTDWVGRVLSDGLVWLFAKWELNSFKWAKQVLHLTN